MTLLIDSRKGSGHLYAPLGDLCRDVSLTTLLSGDCCWLGNGPTGLAPVGVELKRINDFISSLDSGRLSGTQLVAMANHYDYVYLIVEGLYKPDSDDLLTIYRRGRWVPLSHGTRQYVVKQINRFINTLAVKCGVVAWRTGGSDETAGLIADWYHWWQQPWESHTSHLNKTKRATAMTISGEQQSVISRMLQELDGVGRPRAEAIAKVYPTMQDLLERATAEELQAVPYGVRKDGAVLHVGKLTARRVLKQLGKG